MRRREPPPLATWMLRHMTAGDRDEALDGDLLEVFRLGRSDAWYWRQVTAACVESWCSNVSARGPALVFALLWSMLAPVWYATVEAIEASHDLGKLEQILGPLWIPVFLIGWVALHAAFLWAGLLVYQLAHRILGKPLRREDVRRAFWTATLILPPVYGATYVMANLYWYSLPGLAGAKLAASSWGQISDLGTLANLIRCPYFVAMVIALWGTVHPIRHAAESPFAEWDSAESDSVLPMPDSSTVQRFLAFMVAAGLVNSMIAALFLCRLPDSRSVDFGSLVENALMFVAIGTLGGIVGSWLYWKSPASPFREGSPVPFSLFALSCAVGWVWVPAMMLFAEQVSATTAFVAMVGAFLLAKGLRSATYSAFAPAPPAIPQWEDGDLFAESLYRPPIELHGYLIALGLFGAGAALASRSNYTAALLLAMSASLFAWKNTVPRHDAARRSAQVRRAGIRVATAAVPAILLTMWALLDGFAHRDQAAQAAASASSDARSATHIAPDAKTPITSSGAGGYESVVLWPFPVKKEIVPPLAVADPMLAPGTKRPLIIRFDGPYWFLQPPSRQPGKEAHVAQGTPMSVDVESNNAMALVMNAHQKLSTAIPLTRCREIDVEIQNRDNRAGIVSLAVLLSDEQPSSKKTLYLGQQPIASTEPDHFSIKRTPAFESLHFVVPANASIRKFNEITIMFLPDIEHTFVAPKIAIQQFELFPR